MVPVRLQRKRFNMAFVYGINIAPEVKCSHI